MDKPEGKKHPDHITAPLGELGYWQFFVFAIALSSKFPTGWVPVSVTFLTPPNKFTCGEPANVSSACSSECNKVDYDHSVFQQTALMEYDMICDRSYLKSLDQALVMLGMMLGSGVYGVISDIYGRRAGFISSALTLTVFGLLLSASFSLWSYLLFRFMTGLAVGGIKVTSFVLCMEVIGKRFRESVACLYHVPFNLGHMSLPIFAYFLRDWRWFNFSFSVTYVLFIFYICIVPESPRWLFTVGKLDECIAILEKAAKCQNRPTENIRADIEAAFKRMNEKEAAHTHTFADLFRTPNLRKHTILMAYNWIAVCMGYYGVSQFTTSLGGDIFLNVFIGGSFGLLGTLVSVPLTIFIGRKIPTAFAFGMAAIGLLALAGTISHSSHELQVALVSIALLGTAIVFPILYLHCVEIFPTVVRSQGMGFGSFMGRIGSIAAPFIANASETHIWIPPLVFGVVCSGACICTLFLPETRGFALPESIVEGEEFFAKKKNAL